MKLAIVRQTWNPNGGAERFVSRALNVLSQSGELDVTLIARQWESGAGWQTLTVDPPFRNRKAREAGFAAAPPRNSRRLTLYRAMSASPARRFSARATASMPPGWSNTGAFSRRWRAGRSRLARTITTFFRRSARCLCIPRFVK